MEMLIVACIENRESYENGESIEGEWIELPLCNPKNFKEKFAVWLEENLKIKDENDCIITMCDGECDALAKILDRKFSKTSKIAILNQIAWSLAYKINQRQRNTFKAAIEAGFELNYAFEIAKTGYMEAIPEINNDYDFGFYIFHKLLFKADMPDTVKDYIRDSINYEEIGRRYKLKGEMFHTKYGYLYRTYKN